MRVYKHLTYTDRLRIEKWLKEKLRVQEIADKLRVSRNTIYLELKRGEYIRRDGETWEDIKAYSADIAEEKYQNHLREKGPDIKLGKDYKLARYLEKTIIERECSPAAALGYAQNEGIEFETKISVPTLYKYIKDGVFLELTQKQLPRHGEKKRKYEKVERKAKRAPAGESIEKRPKEVRDREEFGHWEMDTVYSGKKKSTRALLTLTERKTREELIIGVENRKAETIVEAINAIEKEMGTANFRQVFKSITMDNGSEFQKADEIEKSCMNSDEKRTTIYFCHPYSSWERGTNENQNGMIRRKHPKGTNFEEVTDEQLKETEVWLNNYPRKIFGYKSSEMMFQQCLKELGIVA